MKDIITNIILSSAGVAFGLLILGRIMPNEKVKVIGELLGKRLSALGNHKVGRKVYEPLEGFIQNSLGVFIEGLFAGLDSDDKEVHGEPEKPV